MIALDIWGALFFVLCITITSLSVVVLVFLNFCNSCLLGKHIKLPFVASSSITMLPFDIIHCDLWTSPILSSSGYRYYMFLLGDFSNCLWTVPLSKKSEAYSTFTSFITFIHTQFERNIKQFQCDNGKEFDNGPFSDFCKLNGINFRLSFPLHHLKMVKHNAKFEPLTISFAPLWLMHLFPLHFGIMLCPWQLSSQHSTKQITKLPLFLPNFISTGSSLLSSTGVLVFILSHVSFHHDS